jgi:CubicO group peptidase (beta-lactamase class C family)
MSGPFTRRRLLRTAGLAGVALGVGTTRGINGKAPLRGIDGAIQKAMTDWEVPGLAVAVVKDGQTVLARGYGVRKQGEKAPVTEQTVFGIGSATKSFTAACVALLVDEGKLRWDDPVTKHLPEFQLSDPWVTREITLRDLLCHRSGLPLGNMLWQNGAFDSEEILRRLRYLKPTSSFRSRYGYQNLPYLVAGQVAARVSGKSWADLVKERLFGPLGMRASSTTTRGIEQNANTATPHWKRDGPVRTIDWNHLDRIGPTGAINSSISDMAAWLQLHLAQGKHEAKRVFSRESAREMHAAQTVIPAPAGEGKLYPKRHFDAYGLGWFVRDYRGRKLVEHSGTTNGFVAWVAFLPEEQLGLVILANLHETGINYALRHTILDAYLGEPERDWSTLVRNDYRNGYQKALREGREGYARQRVKDTKPSLAIGSYAGDYESDLYGKIEVGEQDGKLSLRYGIRFVGSADHWHHDTFRVAFENPVLNEWMITFSLDDRGRVKTLHAQEAPWAPAYMDTADLGPFRRVM